MTSPVDPRPLARLVIGLAPGVTVPKGVPLAGGVLVPVPGRPGRDGLPASQEIQPEQGTYPEQTVGARLLDLIERKAERTDLDTLRTDLDTVIHQPRALDWANVTLTQSAYLTPDHTEGGGTLGVYNIPDAMHGAQIVGVSVVSGDSSYAQFQATNSLPPTEPGTTSVYEDQLYVMYSPDAAPPATLQVSYTSTLPALYADLGRQIADRATHAELASALVSATPMHVLEWTRTENYTLSNVVRSPEGSPTEGALVSADVTWPTGATGRLTSTDANAESASFDGYRITYAADYSVVQPPLVRGADGNVTSVPPLELTFEDN